MLRKKSIPGFMCAIMLFGMLVGFQSTAFAASDYYVSTTGSDSNPGTASQPFLTIVKASQVATPGTTVHVAPGTYVGSIRTLASGTATARIRYVSDTKWGAKLVPPATNSSSILWDNQGSYVDIEGFEVDGNGTNTSNGLYNEGSYVAIKNNHVHDIATNIACTGAGGAAINTDYYYYGVETEISGNVVHNIGFAGCDYIQGIYVSTSGTVKNNLVYQVGGAAVHLWHDANNVTIANNTLFSSWFGVIVGGGDFWHTAGPADNVHVSNNIVIDNTYGISEQGKTGTNNTYTNNLVFDNDTYDFSLKNGLTHTGTITADPGFVYYDRAGGGDYRLKFTSPAIDHGIGTYAPNVDLDGNTRPMGAQYDIGAYEYDPAAFTISAISKKLTIGESTTVISQSNLTGALYSSDNPAVATVAASGAVTAAANGVANITATIPNGSGSTRSATVAITVADRLQSVALATAEPNPEVGQTQQFTLTALMSNGSAANLSNATIRYYTNSLPIATVNGTGLVTGVSTGTTTLNVDVTLDGVTKRASVPVQIDPPTIASVALTASNETPVKGQISQLAISATSNNGKPATLKTATIAYSSSNPAVATVNASGLVTAVAQGTTVLSVNVTLNGITRTATKSITVQPGVAYISGFASLPIIAKSANTILYAPTVQFEGVTQGASITFGVNVPETHLYQVRLKTFKATSYGNYSILVDGQPLAEYNFYGSTGRGTTFESMGSLQLTSGSHQLTFLNIGKNAESSNYKMGVIELELLAQQDATAPTSTAAVQGTLINGWYTNAAQVTLSAVDGDAGVQRTEYRLDGATVWETYTAPIQVSAEGTHLLSYRSVDAAGNVEQTKTQQIKIDQTAPTLTVQLDKTSIWPPNHQMVTINATLNAGDATSGVASVILTSITSNEPDSGDGDIQANIGSSDTSFKVRAERLGTGTGRVYTVIYTATDVAGHQTMASATVSVPHDQSGN